MSTFFCTTLYLLTLIDFSSWKRFNCFIWSELTTTSETMRIGRHWAMLGPSSSRPTVAVSHTAQFICYFKIWRKKILKSLGTRIFNQLWYSWLQWLVAWKGYYHWHNRPKIGIFIFNEMLLIESFYHMVQIKYNW